MTRKSTTNPDGETVKLRTVAPVKAAPTLKVKAPATKVATSAVPVVAGPMLKKAEFIDRAVARIDVKKRDAKPAIEAALAVLADALLAGEEVNLPPMGKIRVVKTRDIGEGAHVLTLKMRTMKDGAGKPKTAPDEF